jgi:DNA invertase Pin-like site-specific DNA recombinase
VAAPKRASRRPRAVAYLRVSTDRQAEHGLGLEIQRDALKQWAKREGFRLVAWCTDEGVSGSNGLEDRDGLAEALDWLRDGQADALAVYRLDRLARDLVVQEQLLAEVWRLGAEVYSTASGEADLRDDPDDPSRRMIRQILGAVSEYERSMIALRLRRGRARKAAAGGFAYGSPGYGYRSEDGVLVPAEREQAALARMIELRDSGASLREIADVLDREGHRPKRAERWHPQTVARVLEREGGD